VGEGVASSGQATMSFLLLPSMAGWATQWTSVQPREHARRWHRRLCRALFGTGSDGFHARATRLEPRRGRDHYHGRCHCVAGAGRRRTNQNRRYRLSARYRRRFNRRAADREDDGCGGYCTSSSDEEVGTCPHPRCDHVINYRQVPDWGKRVRDLTGCGVDHVVEVAAPARLRNPSKRYA